MLAGGFKNDLAALNDTTPHDERCERTVEYGLIVKRLLSDPGPVTFEGRYYRVSNGRTLSRPGSGSGSSPGTPPRPPGKSPTGASRRTARVRWRTSWR
jgi:alkanesulfonate monooxygenase SsuD/methylene tetrahydromethanopterin reductase-like flavin-dependent oxidoreductase (luciferase family)